MSEFSRMLRQDIVDSSPPWGEVNPLVVIGLSEAILELGLNESQFYSIIRSFGKKLVSQVHPDSNSGNFSPERQRQIIEAYAFLVESPENFSKALADFKNLRADDRRETRALSIANATLRERLSHYEGRVNLVTQEREKLVQEEEDYKKLKMKEPLRVPILESELSYQEKENTRLVNTLRGCQRSLTNWKSKYNGVLSGIATMGRESISSNVVAFDARWVAFASLWFTLDSSLGDPSPLDEDGIVKYELRKASRLVGVQQDKMSEILQSWRIAQGRFPDPNGIKSTYRLGLTLVSLRAGRPTLFFGNNKDVGRGRIIGSISSKFVTQRSHIKTSFSQEKITEHFDSTITPGGLLVSVEFQKETHDIVSKFRFRAGRLVLAVG